MSIEDWTLEHNGLVVRRGDLIEYREEDREQLLAAMVVSVSTIGYAGFGSRHPVGTQILSARTIKNRRLPKAEELADTHIAAALVTRKLERKLSEIPLPPPATKTLFSPFENENPWKVETFIIPDEWKAVSRWYPYSLRLLLSNGTWREQGRYPLRETGYQVMKALASERGGGDYQYVLVCCTLQGKEGREKAVVGMPGSLQSILQEREQRRLKERSR